MINLVAVRVVPTLTVATCFDLYIVYLFYVAFVTLLGLIARNA